MEVQTLEKSVPQKVETKVDSENGSTTAKSPRKSPNFFNAPERVPFPAPVRGDQACEDFLKATEDNIAFFCSFGPLFKLITQEILRYAKSLHAVYEKDRAKNKTIRQLLSNEKKRGKHEGAESVIWLKRGLEFYVCVVENICDNICKPADQKIAASVIVPEAYNRTLGLHHGFFSQCICKALMKTLPDQETLVKLCCYADPDEAVLCADAIAHIRNMPSVFRMIDSIFEQLELDTSYRGP